MFVQLVTILVSFTKLIFREEIKGVYVDIIIVFRTHQFRRRPSHSPIGTYHSNNYGPAIVLGKYSYSHKMTELQRKSRDPSPLEASDLVSNYRSKKFRDTYGGET